MSIIIEKGRFSWPGHHPGKYYPLGFLKLNGISIKFAFCPVGMYTYFKLMELQSIEKIMATRTENELKFSNWEALPDEGRRYWLDVEGRQGWRARYVKIVDSAEKTVLFFQEIYDEQGNLVEIHEKFPVDKGHKKMKGD